MSNITFRMAAKTDTGCVRSNNEDNFQASADLANGQMRWVNNELCSLGDKGALLVVADGMGGMNAGEVASEIAIETVREYFAPGKLVPDVVKNRMAIERYMKSVIVEADTRIKKAGRENPESRGMGTTIVIAWIFDKKLYVSWCGDSRAYIWNENTGLFQITKDHSYVQDLVDQGKIAPEDAFDYPDNNIITRSLCDATPKANPDCLKKPIDLCNGDIILLCSDGLNGMLRDHEIEAIVGRNTKDMTECVDALIDSALDAGGVDNVTVALCQITDGGIADAAPDRITDYSTLHTRRLTDPDMPDDEASGKDKNKLIPVLIGVIIELVLICAAGGLWWWMRGSDTEKAGEPGVPTMAETADQVGPTVTKPDQKHDASEVSSASASSSKTEASAPAEASAESETEAAEDGTLTSVGKKGGGEISQVGKTGVESATAEEDAAPIRAGVADEDNPYDYGMSTEGINSVEFIKKNGAYITVAEDAGLNWDQLRKKITKITGIEFTVEILRDLNKNTKAFRDGRFVLGRAISVPNTGRTMKSCGYYVVQSQDRSYGMIVKNINAILGTAFDVQLIQAKNQSMMKKFNSDHSRFVVGVTKIYIY